ncbi:uncharacterized protein LOC144364925 [Ictidomys tridecemlineatus]
MNSAEPRGKEETGEGRAVGGGRRAGPRAALPPIPRPSEPAARLDAAFRQLGEGSGHVPFQSSATRRQVPQALLGGARLPAEAAPRPPPPSAPARLLPRARVPGPRAKVPTRPLQRGASTGSGGFPHPNAELFPSP